MLDELVSQEKTDDELKAIALGINTGLIFTSNHLNQIVKNPEDFIFKVFVPLQFLDEHQLLLIDKQNITLFYEYISNKTSTLRNGLPVFTSVNFLTMLEHSKVNNYVKELRN